VTTRLHTLVLAVAAVSLAVAVRAEDQPPPAAAPDTTAPATPGNAKKTEQKKKPKERSAEATRLEEIVVEAKKPQSAASSDEIRARDYELRPHATTQEILNNIPGLVVAQHQGGGKATQWLIRGFDADHGTDISVNVDDLPINLPTHAHGQGYADLNPLIPETVDYIQLRKGPYFLEYGDFATAGALNVVTLDRFKENFILNEGGSFDTHRHVVGVSHDLSPTVTALAAGQAYFSNGPFEHPQDFSRYNLFTKLTATPSPTMKVQLSTSIYAGDWHGSGQIPLREVSAGRLDRFGAVDPSEGGHSDREDANLHVIVTPTPADTWWFQLYGGRYKLQLFTDFTFFKDTGFRFTEDPGGRITDDDTGRVLGVADGDPTPGIVPGDGIEQNDQRWIYGGKARYTHAWFDTPVPMQTVAGLDDRNDDVNVALHRQVKRQRFYTINQLSVSERSFGPWVGQRFFFGEWARLEIGARGDVYFFDGRNRLPRQRPPCPVDASGHSIRNGRCEPNFTPVPIAGTTSASIISPKANLTITPVRDTDVYLNFGEGFHSNDARNALTGLNSGFDPLTKALGYELGARTRQFGRLDAAAALWLLDLDSELVFSGDAGSQESGASFQPNPATRRWGVDFETRYQFTRWLFADYDLSWADPRYTESSGDIRKGDAVALAPTLLMNGGLTAEFANGFSVALRSRFLDDRPANEDRTITARGYFLLDLLAKYRWRNVEVSLAFLNLTNTDWREAQFVDNSCVRREVGKSAACATHPDQQTMHPVDAPPDIHFTPGNPFGVRAGVKIYF